MKDITCRRCHAKHHTQRRCATDLMEDAEAPIRRQRRESTFEEQYDEYMRLSQSAQIQTSATDPGSLPEHNSDNDNDITYSQVIHLFIQTIK